MRFQPVIAVLFMSMLLQAVSLGGHWAGPTSPTDALHALLHWSGALHHHDHQVTQAEVAAGGDRARAALAAKQLPQALPDEEEGFEAFAEEFAQATLHRDEPYHQDRSLDSRYHLILDACLAAVGLPPSTPSSPLLTLAAVHPMPAPQTQRADPFVDGPRRPPRSLA
jgi:hypothetical protein